MRKRNTEEMELEISHFYQNVQRLLKERNLKWKDLALLIDMDPRSLSSMKSQNQNPGLLAIKKIASVLDVSIDELVSESPEATSTLDELIWALRRLARDESIDINKLSQQLLDIAHTITDSSYMEGNRDVFCETEIQYKLNKAKLYPEKHSEESDNTKKTIIY